MDEVRDFGVRGVKDSDGARVSDGVPGPEEVREAAEAAEDEEGAAMTFDQ